MSRLGHASGIAVVLFALIASVEAGGCVSNTIVPPSNVDSGVPELDAGFDASPVGPGDAGPHDAGPHDATPGDAASDAGTDAGHKAAVPSQVGLVAAGAVSHSPSYTMSGTMGPGSAPVLRSTHYALIGGMSVSARQP